MNRKNKRILIVILMFVLCSAFALIAACQGGKTSESDKPGESAKSAYQQYLEKYPDYEGTEEEWLKDLLDGKLNAEDSGKKMYTVSFKCEETDAKPWMQETLEDGETPDFPGKPEKRGYKFIAWGYQGYEWPFTYPIRQDTTLTAMWEPVDYDIKYNLNGGVNSQYNRDTYTVEQSFDLQTPTKDYYDFGGWYTSPDFDENSKLTEINSGEKGEDLELWAKWTPIAYKIKYAGLEGTTIELPTSYNVESDDITLPQPEREHYTFDGWTGNGTTAPEKTLTITNGTHGDLEYTANWTAIKYKITYDLDGGTNPDGAIYEYTIESFENSDELLLPDPSKVGGEQIKNYTLRLDNNFDIEYTVADFTFGGWFKADDVERTHCYESVQLTDGDLNLVAYWIVNEGNVLTKTLPYCRNGNEVLIGSYPQSNVTDEETLAGLAEFEFDMQSYFNSFRLNIGNEVPPLIEGWTDSGEKYWYKDVEYNGKKYRGLFLVRSRDGSYTQQYAGYAPSIIQGLKNRDTVKIHWFNYDPVKWSVVDEENGKAFLVCKTGLEVAAFGHDTWAQSPIREYLNDTIYNVIFNDAQKATVLQSTVANDLESMGGYGVGHEDFATYATDDYLFLLSYQEFELYKNKFIGSIGTSSYCVATLSKGFTWMRSHYKHQQGSNNKILAFKYWSGEIPDPNPEYSEWGHILPAMRVSLT